MVPNQIPSAVVLWTKINIWQNIMDLSCISTKKVIIELPLSTQCLTQYRRRLVDDQLFVTIFSILDDHYNSNFLGVDVNGRTS